MEVRGVLEEVRGGLHTLRRRSNFGCRGGPLVRII